MELWQTLTQKTESSTFMDTTIDSRILKGLISGNEDWYLNELSKFKDEIQFEFKRFEEVTCKHGLYFNKEGELVEIEKDEKVKEDSVFFTDGSFKKHEKNTWKSGYAVVGIKNGEPYIIEYERAPEMNKSILESELYAINRVIEMNMNRD